ncbi:hypothetical protein BDQ94DRAFT_147649 [Aspergillus welwitschiae]|uniref:Uncharacterized protein n=1 Tax=Aspergillus welwitschiae TaxID=1341132 RepID=A0A3F3PW75_9EURO|nr:hypothetical protein BDQ94DRAFT_147649 [Aspergillus welwitschiae]RDH31204.1 hypothetical protein BDQ94DRAFT_147649 [Aspergillus welwitschiae]
MVDFAWTTIKCFHWIQGRFIAIKLLIASMNPLIIFCPTNGICFAPASFPRRSWPRTNFDTQTMILDLHDWYIDGVRSPRM